MVIGNGPLTDWRYDNETLYAHRYWRFIATEHVQTTRTMREGTVKTCLAQVSKARLKELEFLFRTRRYSHEYGMNLATRI